jgi:hypothetical protein
MIDLAKRAVLQRLHKLGCRVLKKQKHERLHVAAAQDQLFGIPLFVAGSASIGADNCHCRCRHNRRSADVGTISVAARSS